MALWVARAGRHGERESYALSNGAVVVGWEDLPDLSGVTSRDELLPLMLGTYPDDNPNTVKNWETQLWAFTNRFQVDDIVALPLKTQSAVAFGRITGPYRHLISWAHKCSETCVTKSRKSLKLATPPGTATIRRLPYLYS